MEPIKLPEYEEVPLDHVAAGVSGLRILFVNVYAIAGDEGTWTLIDAGLPMSGGRIRKWAERQFGRGSKPASIILTHGHFDHVGALEDLVAEWDVPVYAHGLELPYITGKEKYPPPDGTVGGGLLAVMAPFYPRGPIDIGARARALPQDGTIPGLSGWQWIHTPGHARGHVSLFRPDDGTMLAGDAFCTTNQESFMAVAQQTPELQGPPTYYTPDWDAARESVQKLADLSPVIMAPSHGRPMAGVESKKALTELAQSFDRIAMPDHGRYVDQSHRTARND